LHHFFFRRRTCCRGVLRLYVAGCHNKQGGERRSCLNKMTSGYLGNKTLSLIFIFSLLVPSNKNAFSFFSGTNVDNYQANALGKT
jgi:hypothetical protein